MTVQVQAPVREDGAIEGLTARFIDVGDIRTRYYEEGTGQPVVLCHGGNWGGSSSANVWSKNISDLAGTLRVLAADRVACGLSDNPAREEDYVYRTEVDHMHDFVRALGCERYHLVGQSRGAGLAARLAVEHPDEVLGLTIINSETIAPRWGDFPRRQRLVLEGVFDFSRPPTFAAQRPEQLRALYERMSYRTEHVTDEFVATDAWMATRPKALRTAEVMQGGGQARWDQSLAGICADTHRQIEAGRLGELPILLYWGREDPWAVLEQGHALFELLSQSNPNVRFYTVRGAGHFAFREQPREFAWLLSEFIRFWSGERG